MAKVLVVLLFVISGTSSVFAFQNPILDIDVTDKKYIGDSFGYTSLPQNRVSYSTSWRNRGGFSCAVYGNLSSTEFHQHFDVSAHRQQAELKNKSLEISKILKEKAEHRPCTEWQDTDEDQGPSQECVQRANYKVIYQKVNISLSNGSTKLVHLECDNRKTSRVRKSL